MIEPTARERLEALVAYRHKDTCSDFDCPCSPEMFAEEASDILYQWRGEEL